MTRKLLSILLALLMLVSLVPAAAFAGGEENYISFGHYEQDGKRSNGEEVLEWIALDHSEGKLLLISRYVIANRAFRTDGEKCTWESSDIREWLNNDFLYNAFSEEEQNAIAFSILDNSRRSAGADCGRDTEDRVFLLSEIEAEEYFSGNGSRMAKPTAASEASVEKKDCSWWWLRTMGTSAKNVEGVHAEGGINFTGRSSGEKRGVRPAVWVDLNAIMDGKAGAGMQLWLAELYENGIGVPQDYEEADYWRSVAGESGGSTSSSEQTAVIKAKKGTVLYEENGVRIVFEMFSKGRYQAGGDLDFLLCKLENDSSKTVSVEIFDIRYDDIKTDDSGRMYVEPVPPGGKSKNFLSIQLEPAYTQLLASGFPEIISLRFRIVDENKNTISESDLISLYSQFDGKRNPAAVPLSAKLVDSENVNVEIIGYKHFPDTVVIYYKYDNLTDTALYFNGDLFINGASSGSGSFYVAPFEAGAASRFGSAQMSAKIDGIKTLSFEGTLSEEYLGDALCDLYAEIRIDKLGKQKSVEIDSQILDRETWERLNAPSPSATEKTNTPQGGKAAVDRAVLMDMNGVRVEAVGITMHDGNYAEIILNVSNNSGRTIVLEPYRMWMNGYRVRAYTDICKLKSGSDTVAAMGVDLNYLQLLGSHSLETLDVSFNVKDEDDESIFIGKPSRINVSGVDNVEDALILFEAKLVDEDQLRYAFLGYNIHGNGLVSLYTYVRNDSQAQLWAMSSECSLNGTEFSYMDIIEPECEMLSSVSIFTYFADLRKIDEIVLNMNMDVLFGDMIVVDGYTLDFDEAGNLERISGNVKVNKDSYTWMRYF